MRTVARVTTEDSYTGQGIDSDLSINKNSQESQDTQSLSHQGIVKHIYGCSLSDFSFYRRDISI